MHHLNRGPPGQAPLSLLEEAVVPLDPVPRLALLHQPQTSLHTWQHFTSASLTVRACVHLSDTLVLCSQ